MVDTSKSQFRCSVFLGGLLGFSEPISLSFMGRIRMIDELEKRKAKLLEILFHCRHQEKKQEMVVRMGGGRGPSHSADENAATLEISMEVPQVIKFVHNPAI